MKYHPQHITIAIPTITFILLQLLLPCTINSEKKIPYRNFNHREIDQCAALPLETPHYFKLPKGDNEEIEKIINELKAVIGFLPYAEQSILFAPKPEDSTYDKHVFNPLYKTLIKEPMDGSLNISNLQQKSLSAFLSSNAKRFRAGLGCLSKVANQFELESTEDDFLLANINRNNEIMLFASNQMNHCEKNLMKVLFTKLNKRKVLLADVTIDNFNDPDGIFYRDYSGVKGLKYSQDDIIALEQAFRTYATCHQAFNNIIHRRALENIISIGQMKKCLNEDKPNRFAGKSSLKYADPRFNYIDGYNIGINNGHGVRNDMRTQNNFLLNKGFGFGKINVELNAKTDFPTLPIDSFWINKLKAAVTSVEKLLILDTLPPVNEDPVLIFTEKIQSILEDHASIRPFADLGMFLVQTSSQLAELKNKFILFIQTKKDLNQCLGNYYILCPDELTKCILKGTGEDMNHLSTFIPKFQLDESPNDILDKGNPQYSNNFVMKKPYLLVLCDKNLLKIYAEAENTISGRVFDYSEGADNYGDKYVSTSQACFGVFTSGGKNDKDACRDTMNQACEHALDYSCKESGLYDFLNQNPPSKRIIPNICTYGVAITDTIRCFILFSMHFMNGSLSIRPSGFLSYSQFARIYGETGLTIEQPYNSLPGDDIDLITANDLMDPADYKEEYFFVEGNTGDKFTDTGELYLEFDRTIVEQMIGRSDNGFIIKVAYVWMMVMIIILLC